MKTPDPLPARVAQASGLGRSRQPVARATRSASALLLVLWALVVQHLAASTIPPLSVWPCGTPFGNTQEGPDRLRSAPITDPLSQGFGIPNRSREYFNFPGDTPLEVHACERFSLVQV